MTLLPDIYRIFYAKTSDIVSHNKSLIIGYSRILNPRYPRGPYLVPFRACPCATRRRASTKVVPIPRDVRRFSTDFLNLVIVEFCTTSKLNFLDGQYANTQHIGFFLL
jgi:hypothetical protein